MKKKLKALWSFLFVFMVNMQVSASSTSKSLTNFFNTSFAYSNQVDGAEGQLNPFADALEFLLSPLTGAIAGAAVLAKFILNIVKAYLSADEDPGATKKAIIQFFIVVAVELLCIPFFYYAFSNNLERAD